MEIFQKLALDPIKLSKINTIKDFKTPKNIKQLQAFLGFINFYTKFIENYAETTLPSLKLLKKDIKFEWGIEQQEAFEKIKKLFDKEIILSFPNINKEFILTADASDYAIAVILSQQDDENNE